MAGGYVQQKIKEQNERNQFDALIRARLDAIKREQAATRAQGESVSLLDFVPTVPSRFGELDRPDHLAPYAEALERAIRGKGCPGELRIAFAAPPQHGKTETSLRALLWWDRYFPGKRHAYITYNAERSQSVAKEFIRIAEHAGFTPTGTLDQVELRGGSTVKFGSVGGGLTGYTIDGCCIIDDPIKDQVEARSPTARKNAIDWYLSTARSRRHQGTSYIAMATRWHIEDLSGYLIKNEGFRYINLKAIAEPKNADDVATDGSILSDPLKRKAGESLWPSHKPPEFFAEERRNAYWWAAMYQGEPRPAGGAVFATEPAFYSELPKEGFRGAFGLDLAYSAKTHADWSICIEGVMVQREYETVDDKGKPKTVKRQVLYVVDVQRKQVDAPSFALTLKAKQVQRSGYRMRWYAAGTEKGSADFLIRQGIKLQVLAPVGDKFMRAQRVAAAWNDTRVLLPDPAVFEPKWLPEFLDVVQNFTGINDVHDDDVDALAALWDELDKPNVYGAEIKPILF